MLSHRDIIHAHPHSREVHYEKRNSLTLDELALLISVYERRGRHNEDVLEGMYEKFYPVL